MTLTLAGDGDDEVVLNNLIWPFIRVSVTRPLVIYGTWLHIIISIALVVMIVVVRRHRRLLLVFASHVCISSWPSSPFGAGKCVLVSQLLAT